MDQNLVLKIQRPVNHCLELHSKQLRTIFITLTLLFGIFKIWNKNSC